MLCFGPLSTVYDFLTFAIMLYVFHADETLFRTGWFVESLATQTLVILVIRTAGPAWRSRPSLALVAGIAACVGVGAVLPYSPVGALLGFTPLPPLFAAFLGGTVITYLALVEAVKRWFHRRFAM
jgi:Mg2+-importing ATPase